MQQAHTKKKVLIVLYYYHPYVSGVSFCAKQVAEGLVKRGYTVTVLTSRHEKGLAKNETINGVQVIRRPVVARLNKGLIMPTFWLDIIRWARKNDYVNPHLPLAEVGIASLFIPKKKSVTTYQCDLNLGNSLLDRLISTVSMNLMRLQLHRSRAVVPSSDDYLRHSKMKGFANKATAIYPTVNEKDYHPVDSKALFDRLGVDAKQLRVGFVGRIVYEKGINFLLESIPFLEKKLPNFKVIIVGDYEKIAGGSVKDQLDIYLQQNPDKIIFTGFLSDHERNQFYSGIDVLVLPSVDPLEAFGIVQVEALLCGTPVVASNLPGVREIVLKTGYGRLSELRDPKDIAKQIIAVVEQPKKYHPDRKKVVELFGADVTLQKYVDLLP